MIDDAALEKCVLAMCRARGPGRSLCPSEVARDLDPGDWRALMPRVRDAAARLAGRGEIEVLRRGARVDARAPGGPIRLRWRGGRGVETDA